MLIEAWVQVASKHPDWQLRIFGPGDNMLYQLQADNLGLKGVVHCMGVSDRVYDEMAKASFYVLSSRYEGFGLVLIEAMAVGLPCVAFACPAGPKDIVSDHQDGLLVERNNVRKLADAINYLIEHDEVRQRYAAQAIINSRRYNLDNIMKMWMSLFDNIS